MPAYTQDQAVAYYNTLPPAEKQKVDAGGGPNVAWLTGAVNAGVPDAVKAVGGRETEAGWNEDGSAMGYRVDFQDAADSAEWLGKRKPTPAELRKWAADQHARYVSGDRTAQDEDYERFDDRQLAAWISEKWDVGRGGFFSPNGERIGKPTDADSQGVDGYGKTSPQPGAGGGGAAPGPKAPAPPPPPTTFGNQLSMTGNVMQDMLIQQFNTGQQSTYSQGSNIFGLGEDRQAGGTGLDADGNNQRMAQTLSGGGLWWGQGQDAFGGFRADQKNTQDPAAPAPAPQPANNNNNNPSPQPPAPGVTPPPPTQGAPNQNEGISDMMSQQQFRPRQVNRPIPNMMTERYTNNSQPPRFF